MTYHNTIASPSEIERLIWYMPAVADRAENEWAKGFARSITRQARKSRWRPSKKQLPLMRDLVSDLFTHAGTYQEGVFDVVESY